MKTFLSDILTEKDGKSYCPVRFCGLIGFFVFVALCFIELIRHCSDFNLVEAASGMSIILGVLAGGVTLKGRGE